MPSRLFAAMLSDPVAEDGMTTVGADLAPALSKTQRREWHVATRSLPNSFSAVVAQSEVAMLPQ